MITIDRETKITFDGNDAWDLTQLAKYVIEVIQTGSSKGHGYDDDDELERFKKLAYRLDEAIPNEGVL